jgi:hypothetical protein
MALQAVTWEITDWIDVVEDRDRMWALVNVEKRIQVP